MERNEVACSLRLVCTAAAAALPGPVHTTVRLSEPSPPAAFALHWSRPEALRSLTCEQREQLELLTARSGSIANLQTLAARGDLPILSRSPDDWAPLLEAAARHGRPQLCAWLREQGVPVDDVVAAAAKSGEVAVVQIVLDTRSNKDVFAAALAAAHYGHVQLMDWLLGRSLISGYELRFLLPDAAHGCSLDELQRLHARFLADQQPMMMMSHWQRACWVEGAAGSPTPDWREKVEWLEALGCSRDSRACIAAASQPDALARLQWLVGRGYALDIGAASAAAEAGNAEALQYALAQGAGVNADEGELGDALFRAAGLGHLAVAQVLHSEGTDISLQDVRAAAQGGHLPVLAWAAEQLGGGFKLTADVLLAAAEGGHLPVVAWAAEQLGAGLELTADLFCAAARSGSWPLLRWLHEHGCPWDATVFVAAVWSCSEEQLEWLVEHGCPMGDDGAPYVTAVDKHDLLVLRCLRRLGCPFAPDGLHEGRS